MGGKGSVLMVSGLPGNPDNTLFEKGAHSVFDNCPGVKVVQTLEAELGPGATAKSMTLQYLETHRGQKIDGVWDSSGITMPYRSGVPDGRYSRSSDCKWQSRQGIPRLLENQQG